MLRKINDFILYICFCFIAGTGLMMKLSFIKGMGKQTVIGLSKHDWETLHIYVGVLMIISVVLHLFINRLWLLKVGASNKKWAMILALALGVILFGVLVFTPVTFHKA